MLSCSELHRRTASIRMLALGLILASCNSDPIPVEPPADGTLHLSTATLGDDPDRDGFRLSIDRAPSIAFPPSGSLDLTVSAGRHALSLLGVAGQCSVEPGTPLDVDVRPGETIRVALVINCSPVGVSLTIKTTGVELDRDGYTVAVDGVNGRVVPTVGTTFAHIDPGSHTITLTGLATNCAIAGPSSQTVSIVAGEVTPIGFDVICTPTTGVIRVTAPTKGPLPNVRYDVGICNSGANCFDESPFPLGDLAPNDTLIANGLLGQNTLEISNIPPNCVARDPAITVSVVPGDTVDVAFAVTCAR